MRDPKRIDPILSTLRELWQRDPDIRLGQLFVNTVRPSEPCPDLFYIEDGDLLKKFLAQLKAT